MLSDAQLHRLRTEPIDGPNRLRFAMRLAGITQEQLEAKMGIPQPTISKVVRGSYSRLPIETARKYAAVFGCHIEDLFPAREAVAS